MSWWKTDGQWGRALWYHRASVFCYFGGSALAIIFSSWAWVIKPEQNLILTGITLLGMVMVVLTVPLIRYSHHLHDQQKAIMDALTKPDFGNWDGRIC